MDEHKREKLKKYLFIVIGGYAFLVPLGFDLFHPNEEATLSFLRIHTLQWPIILCVYNIGYMKGSKIKNWSCFLLWWMFWITAGIGFLCLIRNYRLDWVAYSINTVLITTGLFLFGLLMGGFFWAFSDD